jgi:hypothetical protein
MLFNIASHDASACANIIRVYLGGGMRAYRIESFGGVDGVVPGSRDDPQSGTREILVRVRATSLNYRDLMVLKGGGRGPTRDISPLSTLINCGNSSILVLRKKAPIRVTLGSLLEVVNCPDCAAFSTIVRILQILNGLKPLPIRSCLKNTGPLESNFTSNAIRLRNGARTIKPKSATAKSKQRLITFDTVQRSF